MKICPVKSFYHDYPAHILRYGVGEQIYNLIIYLKKISES